MRVPRYGVCGLRAALLLLVLVFARRASADGFQLERYEPTPAGDWFFAVNHPWYSSTRYFAGGVTLDYAHDPLLGGSYSGDKFTEQVKIVEHMVVGHVDVAGSLWDRVQLSFSLPITLHESGTTAFGVSPLSGAAVSDPRIGVMVRLWGQPDRSPISIHLGGYVWIPIGANNDHQGDPTARGLPQIILAGRFVEHLRWTFNGGVLIRSASQLGFGPASASGTELSLGGAIAYADVPRRFQIGPEVTLGSVLVNGHAFKQGYTNLDVLLGGQYNVASQVQLGAAVGFGTLGQLGEPDVRVIFRAAYAPIRAPKKVVPPDADQDGIPDAEDQCPQQAGGSRTRGCPDADNDGIPDAEDLCPNQPPGAQPDDKKRGCPVIDADQDGVPDAEDMCPGESVGAKPDPKRPGCPWKDADNDGIPDAEDLCPSQGPGQHPDATRNGCPMPDADNDGIPDAEDACPQEPGLASAQGSLNGCPKIEIKQGGITELKRVNFEVNKSVLLPESFPILDEVAKALNSRAELSNVIVEGHADDTGTHEWNLRLSKHRAQTVMEYLIKKGVPRRLLSSVGYGDTQPLDPSRTAEARAINRRVEIRTTVK